MRIIITSIAILIVITSLLLFTINLILKYIISNKITIYKTSEATKQIASIAIEFFKI